MNENTELVGFSVLFEAIKQARYNALKLVNSELVNLYWQIGGYISKQLNQSKWGDKAVQQFSDFLLKNDPTLKGFDRKSLYRMIQFYESYQGTELVKVIDGEVNSLVTSVRRQMNDDDELVTAVRRFISGENIKGSILAKLSWTHHRTIFSRCKLGEDREFYLKLSIKENYSVRELDRQISTGAFERAVLSSAKIPLPTRNIYPDIGNTFKDSYVFEFLNLPEPHSERDLQKGLFAQMKSFILELGKEFLFVGEEYKIQVGNTDFFIDLLFFHRGLQCLVAFELKADKFRPEHMGQLNFYLEALDRDVKNQNENPSIGVLLCKDKDNEVVEYALSRSLSPAMVSDYKTRLPDKKILQDKLHEFFDRNNNDE